MKARLAVLFVLVMCIGTSAYAIEPLKSDIPFAFSVGDHMLPAGIYRIDSASSSGADVVKVRRVDGHEAVFAFTRGVERSTVYEVITTWKMGAGYDDPYTMAPVPETSSNEVCFVFNRYGNDYFLSKVWVRGIGREFLKGTAEKAAMAANPSSTHETIFLAAAIQSK
jgi:hypothetical protein